MDVNAHLDDTGISHGTKQGLMRAHGIDRGTSQARMETPRESDKLTLEQSAQGIDEKKSPRFQTDRAQTESTQEQGTPPHFDSQKLMEMMVKEFFQQKEEDRKWEKKEKPDSA